MDVTQAGPSSDQVIQRSCLFFFKSLQCLTCLYQSFYARDRLFKLVFLESSKQAFSVLWPQRTGVTTVQSH